MKKIILTVILMMMFVIPAFAAEQNLSEFDIAITQIDIHNSTTGNLVNIFKNTSASVIQLDITKNNIFSGQPVNIPSGHYDYIVITHENVVHFKVNAIDPIQTYDFVAHGSGNGYGHPDATHYFKAAYTNFDITNNTTTMSIQFGAKWDNVNNWITAPQFNVTPI